MKNAGLTAAATAFIFVLALVAYSNSFGAGFHYDDFHQLVKNQHMRSLANVPAFFTDARQASFTSEDKGYRPLTYTTFALNYALSGYGVTAYHAFNFVLHLLCAFLVFLVVREVLEGSGREGASSVALAVSALFALHPIQTNAVTYVSGRAAVLAAFFYLSAFLGFLRFRSRGGYFWWAVPPLLYLAGLLSKEMAVSLPAVMLVYDLMFTVPKARGSARPYRAFYYYIPFAAVLAFYLAVRRSLIGSVAAPEMVYGVGPYFISELKVLLMYIRLLILPMNQNVDYALPVTNSMDAGVAAGALVVGLALYALYRARKLDPAASFFGFWFFIALAPESSLIPITDLAVEYRLYLPSVGFIACAALLVRGRLRVPAYRKALTVAAVLLLGALTFNRNGVWATEYTLWSDAARKSPHSPVASGSLGSALMDEGRYAEAVKEFERALAINPLDPQVASAYNNLGVCYLQLGMPDKGAEMFRKVIEFEPGHRSAYVNLGLSYLEAGRYQESMEVLTRGETLFPDFPELHATLSAVYKKQGMLKEALSEMREAYRYSPMDFEVAMELAELYEMTGLKSEAREQAGISAGLASDQKQQARVDALMARLQGK